MMIRIGLIAIGALYVLNGLRMLATPEAWYESVPGVSHTGPFNEHFVRDIAFAYLASGAATWAAVRDGAHRAVSAAAGATWPALHAAFHVTGWFAHGLPADAVGLALEIGGVLIPAVLGAWIAGHLLTTARGIA